MDEHLQGRCGVDDHDIQWSGEQPGWYSMHRQDLKKLQLETLAVTYACMGGERKRLGVCLHVAIALVSH